MRLPPAVFFTVAAVVSIQASALPFFDLLNALKEQRSEATAHKNAPQRTVGLGKVSAEGDTVSGVFGMGTGTVTGVLNSPLSSSSNVKLFDEFGYEHGSLNCGNPGTFIFRGVYPGRYTVGVGYEDGWLGNTRDASAITWADVAEGQTVNVDTITIPGYTVVPVDSITISGHLYRGTGTSRPFVGSGKLQYSRSTDIYGQDRLTVTTDASGAFRVRAPMSSGSWHLLFSDMAANPFTDSLNVLRTGMVCAPVWIGDERIHAIPSAVQVSGDLSNIAVHLDEGGSVVGSILDPDSSYILESVDLYLIETTSGMRFGEDYIFGGYSGGSHTFSFKGLPSGSYILRVAAGGSKNIYAPTQYWPGTPSPAGATTIAVGPGTSDTLTYTLMRNPGTTIPATGSNIVSGTVIAPGRLGMAPYVRIHSNGSSVSGGGSSSAAPVMTYSITNSRIDQPITISASMDDIYLRETWYRSGSSTTTEDSATILNLAAGETKSGLDITMPEGGSIAGRVIDSDGQPLNIRGDMAPMVVATRPGVLFSSRTSYDSPLANGFHIPGVSPGSYALSLTPFNFSDASAITPQYTAAAVADTLAAIPVTLDSSSVVTLVAHDCSGMIRGTFHFDVAVIGELEDLLVYAVRPNGSIAGVTASWYEPGLNDTNNIPPINLFFRPEFNAADFSQGVDFHLAVGGLPAGDYTIAIGYETADGVMLRWYGQSTATPVNDFPWNYRLTVPAEAITITLPTSATLVDNINFGSTPISSFPAYSSGLSLSARSSATGLHISWTGLPQSAKVAELSLCSLTGRVLFSQTVSANKGMCAVDRPLAAGLYVLRLSAGDVSRTMKVMR